MVNLIRYANNENKIEKGKFYFVEYVDMFALTGDAEYRKLEQKNIYQVNDDILVWANSGINCGIFNYGKFIDLDISFAKIETNLIPPKENFILVPLFIVKMRIDLIFEIKNSVSYEYCEIIL